MANYDQRGQIVRTQNSADAQINIETVNIQPPITPGADELLKRGIGYVEIYAYDDAIKAFEESIKAQPSPQAFYYLALALLRGGRPKALTLKQAQAIEQKLQSARALGNNQAHHYYLWAWLKFDFYRTNGFLVRPPSVEELIIAAQNCPMDPMATSAILKHAGTENSQIGAGIESRLRSM